MARRVTALVNLPAMLVSLAATTLLLIVGIRESARVNAVIVAIKVSVVLAHHRLGGMFISTVALAPVHPAERRASSAVYGWSGVLRGAGRHLLRLHRLRRRLDGGAGSPPIRSATCRVGIIGSLIICTDPLRARLGRDGRARAVSRARRGGADGRRRGCGAHQGAGIGVAGAARPDAVRRQARRRSWVCRRRSSCR